jgi:hypothetical protein
VVPAGRLHQALGIRDVQVNVNSTGLALKDDVLT